jgi:hypothetical protein
MKGKGYCILLFLFILGCANVASYRKPGTDFRRYKGTAVFAFSYPSDPSVGQEVARSVGRELMRTGYAVIDGYRLQAIVDVEKVKQYGLTDSDRSVLQRSGINAAVFGTVRRHICFSQEPLPFLYWRVFGADSERNNCWVAFSFKMLDLQTDEPVLSASGYLSITDEDMTEEKVLEKLLVQISAEIPPIE